MSQRRRRNGSPVATPPTSPSAAVGSSRPVTGAGSSASAGALVGLIPGWSSSGRLLPMKATVPFQLRHQTASVQNQAGQEWNRLLSPSSSSIHRTSSLDALTAPYLAGHWPKDVGHTPSSVICVKDEITQTEWVEEWKEEEEEEEMKSRLHKRSASWGSADHLKEVAKLRQQLQRRKHSSRCHRDTDRKSPFNGSHMAVHQSQAPVSRCVLLARPVSKATVSRLQSSLERLNQEIERINITHTHITQEDIPDGRRAPPPLHQSQTISRTVDTQTTNSASNTASTSDHSVSSPLPEFSSSPKPNNSFMFKREPPEGCDRVKVFTDQPHRQQRVSVVFAAPDRNKVNFVSNSGSAFSLLIKPSNQLRQ